MQELEGVESNELAGTVFGFSELVAEENSISLTIGSKPHDDKMNWCVMGINGGTFLKGLYTVKASMNCLR